MGWSTPRLWFRSLLRRDEVERELEAELRFHIEEQVAENVGSGMTPEEARRGALRAMGGVAQIAEECRDARRLGLADTLWQDLRFDAHMLAKHRVSTVVTVLMLAVGIGFNTLAFSAGRALLVSDLPVRRR